LSCAKVEALPRPQQPREYAVYAAVLRAMFFDPAWRDDFAQMCPGVVLQLVIMHRTSLGVPPVLAMTSLGTDRALQKLAPIQDGLFEQLLKDNKTSADLENRFELEVPVTFLRDEDLDTLRSTMVERGWSEFWARHQLAEGLLILSRVTFDRTGNVALVYAANGVGNLQAGGYLLLLKSVGGRWSV